MNSQFSIGFVIALVIGIVAGAFWPKYGVGLGDAVIDRGPDAQAVNYALANEGRVGRGQGVGRGQAGGCEQSNDVFARCAGHKKSKQEQLCHGCSGEGEGSHECSSNQCAGDKNQGRGQHGKGRGGSCEESHHGAGGRCAGSGNAREGTGGRGRSPIASNTQNDCRNQKSANVELMTATTRQESCEGSGEKASCTELKCQKDTGGRGLDNGSNGSDESGRDRRVDRELQNASAQHHGLRLGLGLGPGWRRGLRMDDAPEGQTTKPIVAVTD